MTADQIPGDVSGLFSKATNQDAAYLDDVNLAEAELRQVESRIPWFTNYQWRMEMYWPPEDLTRIQAMTREEGAVWMRNRVAAQPHIQAYLAILSKEEALLAETMFAREEFDKLIQIQKLMAVHLPEVALPIQDSATQQRLSQIKNLSHISPALAKACQDYADMV